MPNITYSTPVDDARTEMTRKTTEDAINNGLQSMFGAFTKDPMINAKNDSIYIDNQAIGRSVNIGSKFDNNLMKVVLGITNLESSLFDRGKNDSAARVIMEDKFVNRMTSGILQIPADNGNRASIWAGYYTNKSNATEELTVRISGDTINTWDADNGSSGATSIPAVTAGQKTEIVVSSTQAQRLAAKTFCEPGSGASDEVNYGYIIKGIDYANPSNTRKETVFISESEILADGRLKLTLTRGVSVNDGSDDDNDNEYDWATDEVLEIEEGDVLVVGGTTPTTDCIGTRCVSGSLPKISYYVATAQEFVDTIYRAPKRTEFGNQRRGTINERQALVDQVAGNIDKMWAKIGNSLIYGAHTNAAGHPRPLPDATAVNPTYGYEVGVPNTYPNSTRGLISIFEQFATKVEFPITSLMDVDQVSSEEAVINFYEIAESAKSEVIAFGDIHGIQELNKGRYASLGTEVFPTTLNEASNVRDAQSAVNGSTALDFVNKMTSGTIEPVTIGGKTVRGVHDNLLAELFPGRVYLVPIKGIELFTVNNESEQNETGFNYYTNSKVENGMLIPSAKTEGLESVVNAYTGETEMVAKNNCGYHIDVLLTIGIRIHPNYLSSLLQLQYFGFNTDTASNVSLSQIIRGTDVSPATVISRTLGSL